MPYKYRKSAVFCARGTVIMKMTRWPLSRRIGWWFFVVWTLLVTLIVGRGAPLLAMPSAGQPALTLELTALGFVAAIGIGAVVEAWMGMLRGHR
jgi:hypothetical protein